MVCGCGCVREHGCVSSMGVWVWVCEQHDGASIVFTYGARAEEQLLQIAALTLLHYCAQGVVGYFEDIEELTHTHSPTPTPTPTPTPIPTHPHTNTRLCRRSRWLFRRHRGASLHAGAASFCAGGTRGSPSAHTRPYATATSYSLRGAPCTRPAARSVSAYTFVPVKQVN